MRRPLAGLLLICVLLSGCAAELPDEYEQVPDFALSERSGRTVTLGDLHGKVWVASFTFTRCTGACWQIAETMTRLQKEFASRKDFLLVTFSVDPEHDTPEVVQTYADQKGADAARWLFLTGKQDDVYRLIEKGFRLHVEQQQGAKRTPGNEVLHTPKVVLVDRQGRMRGYYDARQMDDAGNPVDEYPQLRKDIHALLGVGPLAWLRENVLVLPTLNAVLNGLSALLLVTGYLAVRSRRIALHKACMLSALGVSVVFLASYLFFHFVVRDGTPTRFSGVGWLRGVYFAVLLSHTVLAAIVPFLAVYTAYKGLRNDLARHVRVARWTLPIWLYVSITGVVVYWMLYHL